MTNRTVVYVVGQPPHPLNNGLAIRQFHLLRGYARNARVRLVCFSRPDTEKETLAALAPYCASVHPIPMESRRLERALEKLPTWRRVLRELAVRTPLTASLCFSEALRDEVSSLAETADLVHVGRLWMVPNVEELLTAPRRPATVLDLDDVESILCWRTARTSPWPRAVALYRDWSRILGYQKRALAAFDRVLVCSDVDRRRLGRPNVRVVENGAPVPTRRHEGEDDGRTLLFCGTLSWPQNTDALVYFLRQIFPAIEHTMPGVKLLIVGRSPGPAIQHLHDGRRITVAADVPSVEPYYRRATASVVPIRIGGGTRLKILESFAIGTPVVSTSIGCEGLDVIDHRHLLIADDPREFADRCVEVMNNRALRRALTTAAMELVSERYSWDAITTRMTTAVEGLLRTRRGGRQLPRFLNEASDRSPKGDLDIARSGGSGGAT